MSQNAKARRYLPLAITAALVATVLPFAPATAGSSLPGTAPAAVESAAPFIPAARSITRDPREVTVFVNKDHPISPRKYIPQTTRVTGSTIRLRPEAAKAFNKMARDAARDGVRIKAVSGYRSYARQSQLFSHYTRLYGKAYASRIAAVPGTSEHQTGLAVDVGNHNGACALQACFAGTPVGRWVARNGHRYGFIIRYPKGQESVTGYAYEPWHLRYLGTSTAGRYKASGAPSLEAYHGLDGPTAPRQAPDARESGRTTANLNLRAGAGTGHRIILTIPKGKTVSLVGAAKSGWYPVRYAGTSGWVSGMYLAKSTGSQKDEPRRQSRTTAANLNLRAGVGTGQRILLTIPKGKTVSLIGAAKSGWYPVRYAGTSGWVSGRYLR